ncbi:MAG: uracil-DNA glycosylase [Acidimicrobiia bacterium]
MTLDYSHIATLDELSSIAANCTDCPLSATRTNVVFAAGRGDADVMVVGEGPGQQEDEQGEPFVGRSGQLLTDLLAEADIARDDVYIANVVKCRPPHNRDPKPEEIDACKPYLRRQIELVDPKVVITLGNFSSKLLMPTTVGITQLRGSFYPWWGRYLVPTFHPAAALRGGRSVTDNIRSDIAIVRALLDGKLGNQPDRDRSHEPDRPRSRDRSRDEQLGLFGATP